MSITNTAKKIRFYQSQSNPSVIEKIELWEQSTWDFWTRKTWVKFIFLYASNDFNKKLGRVGRISSTRIGTRNLDLIPSGDKPQGRNPSSKTKRYYDVSRAGTTVVGGVTSGGLPGKVKSNSAQLGQWRSFRPDTFSIMTEIWSFEKEKWVSKLSDFNDRDSGPAGA